MLALRSSMSDMDWLLDGETAAPPMGDIVIYNKYVTRTVAVDSSADGAADDLDDQFSMDAEGENGAELETSGASALDAAPAAEDAPAADSVITPRYPRHRCTRNLCPQRGFPRCRATDHYRDRRSARGDRGHRERGGR